MENANTQAKPKAGRGGIIPPIDKRFGQPNGNPQGHGFWRKEDTARYKLEQMLKLDEKTLEKIANDRQAPVFERRIAKSILKETDFSTTEKMINQVYGQPKATQETVISGELTQNTNPYKNFTREELKELLKK